MTLITNLLQRKFQSTLPAWGETMVPQVWYVVQGISIHSPRMGRDAVRFPLFVKQHISIHSPRMGRDQCIL